MFFKYLSAGIALVLVVLISLANSGNGQTLLTLVHIVPYGDKWLHLIFMGSLTAALNLALDFKIFRFRNTNFQLGALIVAAFITGEEFSQGFNPHRNFEVLDLVCNYIGVFGIGYIPVLLRKKSKGKSPFF